MENRRKKEILTMPFEKSPDTVKIAERIKAKIASLEGLVKQIKSVALKTAQNSAEYEKQLAITIIKLQNGAEMPIGDVTARDVKQTTLERTARGICYDYVLKRDTAQAMYKGLITRIEAEKAILNGYQSIFKHLSEA